MIRPLSALCGVLTLLATLGCGNKGPLYLPEEATEPPPANLPAEQEKEA